MRFVTSDATPHWHGAIDWTGRACFRRAVSGDLAAPIGDEGLDEAGLIATAELLALAVLAAEQGDAWRHALVMYGGDNENVRVWLLGTAPRPLRAQALLRAFLNQLARLECELRPFMFGRAIK